MKLVQLDFSWRGKGRMAASGWSPQPPGPAPLTPFMPDTFEDYPPRPGLQISTSETTRAVSVTSLAEPSMGLPHGWSPNILDGLDSLVDAGGIRFFDIWGRYTDDPPKGKERSDADGQVVRAFLSIFEDPKKKEKTFDIMGHIGPIFDFLLECGINGKGSSIVENTPRWVEFTHCDIQLLDWLEGVKNAAEADYDQQAADEVKKAGKDSDKAKKAKSDVQVKKDTIDRAYDRATRGMTK